MGSRKRLYPRSSRKTRLLLAALLWLAVGTGLLVAGAFWLASVPSLLPYFALPVALAVGFAKGRFVLVPLAERNAERIVAAGEDRCIGGVFPWSSWALVAVMVIGGIALRRSSLPRPWLGVIYAAIGMALLTGSWGGWRRFRAFSTKR